MEKSGQEKVQYMMNSNELWIDTRLTEKCMQHLHQAILESENISSDWNVSDNVSRSKKIIDKDNWFYETALKRITEKMFYRDWDNYYKYVVDQEEPPPKFELIRLWVNHQKQHEFLPIHNHSCLYSFVIFIKIPTHWKEQHVLPFVCPFQGSASNFQFVWPREDRKELILKNFSLSSEDEGRILFFPAWLQHQVYPFYGTEEERVTISGNIALFNSNRLKMQELPVGEYEQKENTLKILENSVEATKKELQMMKKEREK